MREHICDVIKCLSIKMKYTFPNVSRNNELYDQTWPDGRLYEKYF